MNEEKVTDSASQHKPTMKPLTLMEIPDNSTMQVKADGELSLIVYNDGEAYTLNGWNVKRTDFPALNELQDTMRTRKISQARFLCDLIAYDAENDRPLRLPDLIHNLKGKDGDIGKVRIALWDLLEVNGKPIEAEAHLWKCEEMSEWFKGCKLVYVLPIVETDSPETLPEGVRTFWYYWVVQKGYEGLVIRKDSDIWKVKPIKEVDAVIFALKKNDALAKYQKVTSFRIALMNPDGSFVEVSDVASGIDYPTRSALYKLTNYKLGEDEHFIYVKPFVVCVVEYVEVFKSEDNRRLSISDRVTEVGKQPFVHLRSPRLTRFRRDKTANPTDLRLEQIIIPQG